MPLHLESVGPICLYLHCSIGFFPSSPMSDGPIHEIKYSNSIQEINWLYSLFASVIPGVSTRSLDRTKLIAYTTSRRRRTGTVVPHIFFASNPNSSPTAIGRLCLAMNIANAISADVTLIVDFAASDKPIDAAQT